MLVLALEFSRGKTAHAWAGHHRWTTTTSEDTARPGHARGEWSAGATSGKRTRPRGAQRLDSEGLAHEPRPRTRRRDVTGIDPLGRSLKTE
jgi:hypothetical protein